MPGLIDELTAVETLANDELAQVTDVKSLEDWRVSYLGRRQGRLPGLLEQLPACRRKNVARRDNSPTGCAARWTRHTLSVGPCLSTPISRTPVGGSH